MTTYPPEVQQRLDFERAVEREMKEFSVTVALSLTQPWATLVAIGEKKYETRSWGTSYRGWIGIHASKGFPVDCRELCAIEPFRRSLLFGRYEAWADLPTGHLLAVARLTDVLLTNRWTPPENSDEYAFGNYGPGRLAWKLEAVRQLREPIQMKGALSIWKMPRPITLADLQ